MHATHGVLLPLTCSASLLALSLSSDVDIHGTKLIPDSLYPNSGTHGPVVLSSCSGRASVISWYPLRFVCGLPRVCVLVCALSRSLK